MKCTYCGFETDSNDLFCNNCGRRMQTSGGVPSIEGKGNNGPAEMPTPPKPVAPTPNNSGKKTGVIAASVAAVICVIAICITVAFVAINKSSSSDEKNTVADEAVSTTDAKDFNAPPEKEDDKTEQASQSVKIYAGTRCRVMNDLDGSKSLALRAAASKNSEAKAYAGKGDYVTATENYYGGDYIKVSLESEGVTYHGWLLADYIYAVNDSEGDSREYSYLKAGTTCRVSDYIQGGYNELNLWKKPRKDEGYYTKVPCGGYVKLLADYDVNDNGYVYAAYGGEKGWILAEWLEVSSGEYYQEIITTTKKQVDDRFGIAGEVQLPDSYCEDRSHMVSGISDSDELPLRTAPGASSGKIDGLENGEMIDVVGKSSQNDIWVLVRTEGDDYGWVNSNYLISVMDLYERFESPIFCYVDVSEGDVLPLRRGAGANTAKILGIKDDEYVYVYGRTRNDQWWLVLYGDYIGWVNRDYLDV